MSDTPPPSLKPFVRIFHLRYYGAHVNPAKCLMPPTCGCGLAHPCPAAN